MADDKIRDEGTPSPEKESELTVEKVLLDSELEQASGGWEKNWDNGFGVHLKPIDPKGTL